VKNIFSKIFIAAFLSMVFFACKPHVDVPAVSKGSLDLTNFVAIGNSISAGYADNALYHGGQEVSFPNLIAQQFKLAGAGNFKQPYVDASSVGIGVNQNARYALAPAADCSGAISLAPVAIANEGDFNIFTTSVAAQGPFNNMAVPGAKAITTIYPGYGNPSNGPGNFNPFFTRMTANPASASILSDAASQNPSFWSLSIGNDDVYTYALAGGAWDGITPSAGPAGFGFDASIDAIAGTLLANGSKGVIANIPDISSIPYFNTIPYNGLVIDQPTAAALSAAYAPLGITFQAGANGFIIEDAGAPGGMRQIQAGEMVLLSIPQDSLKCGGWGSMKPIPNQFVLTATEITQVNNAVSAYNTKLKAVADANGLAFVDVKAFMQTVKTGVIYNGVGINASFVSGGAFSLDGVHMTPLGNALLANAFIKSINSKYGSTIPQIDATRYKGVAFP
jgi:lysophospholipase L1-like esterase